MAPRTDPEPLLPHKARLETSYAFSRTFNPRNLEFLWYPLWCQTLFDLAASVPNLIVAPQFPVWIIRHHDNEHEDANEGDDPEEIEEIQGEEQHNEPEEGDYEDGAGDISFASTVPEKKAEGVLVDFAILSLRAVPQPKEKLRYGGWRITGASVCLLVELKRFVNRSLKDDELNQDISSSKIKPRIPSWPSPLRVRFGAAPQYIVTISNSPCTFFQPMTQAISPRVKNSLTGCRSGTRSFAWMVHPPQQLPKPAYELFARR